MTVVGLLPISLRAWDRAVVAVGALLTTAALPLVAFRDPLPAAVALLGGAVVAACGVTERRRREMAVWVLAHAACEPKVAHLLHERMCRLRISDLADLAAWSAIGGDALDAPPRVRALLDLVRRC